MILYSSSLGMTTFGKNRFDFIKIKAEKVLTFINKDSNIVKVGRKSI